MLMIDIDKLDWEKQSLIPAIVQDTETKQVLMLAYMNEEALKLTLETKKTWFWSRSRKELWNKGATSGHIQEVVDIKFDCDADTILVTVTQAGVACHTGSYTCFSEEREKGENKILRDLADMIAQRDKERPEGSYTTYLLEKGLDKILKKVGEEASEVIIAAKNQSKEELVYEASDLIYHLFVLLHQQKISFDDILGELTHRYLAKNER